MNGLNRALAAIAFAALIAGVAAAALIASSDHSPSPVAGMVIGLAITWSFIGTGLYAWWRRPANRFGALMTAVGFTFMLGALTSSDDSVVFTLGVLLSSLYFVVFAHMVLAYPDGRLERPWHAKLLAAGYVLALIGPLPQLLWGYSERMTDACPDCPPSALLIERNDGLREAVNGLVSGIGVAIEVDGGIDVTTAGPCAAAGATAFVAGSAVFGAADPGSAYREIAAAALPKTG